MNGSRGRRLASAMLHPRVVKRWTLADDIARGAPRELDRYDTALLVLSEVVHHERALGRWAPVWRDLCAATAGAAYPYPDPTPISAKMLTHGIVANARGRPRRDLLAETMQAPPRVPVPQPAHVDPSETFCRRSGRRRVWQCDDGHAGYQFVPCMRADCEMCAERLAARREERLDVAYGGADMAHIVLTIPPALRRRVGVDQLAALRTLARDVLVAWFELVDQVDVGVLVGFHPAGDKSPDAWAPHFDCCVPLIGVDQWGNLVELQRHRDEHELDLLTMLWHGATLRALRLAGKSPAAADHAPNAHWSFALVDNIGQVAHRLRYMARPFPTWSASDELRSAHTRVRRYGLANGNSKHPAAARYRARVAAPRERKPVPCIYPDCDCEMSVVDIGDARFIRGTWRWALDLDRDALPQPVNRATGPPERPPDGFDARGRREAPFAVPQQQRA